MPATRFLPTGALLAGVLLSVARPGCAQDFPRYYVGLAAYSSHTQQLGSFYQGVRLPGQLVVGYQLRPRLAVQLGAAYSRASGGYAFQYPNSVHEFRETRSNTSTALLARYALPRRPESGFQVDVLAGFTLETQRTRTEDYYFGRDSANAPLAASHSEQSYRANNLLLTVGCSPSYYFGRRLMAVLDITVSKNVDLEDKGEFIPATALGLRYRFGYR